MEDLAKRERFCDRKRPIPVLGLGREQLDLHPVFGQRAQRKRGLERSDAAPRDQNMSSLATHGVLLTCAPSAPSSGADDLRKCPDNATK